MTIISICCGYLGAIAVVFGYAFAFSGDAPDPITAIFQVFDMQYGGSIHSLGVWFLFFISGSLVSASYAYRRNIKEFLSSRFLRIYPGLFCVISVSVLAGAFITSLPLAEYFSDKETWKYFSRNILGFTVKYELPGVFQGNPLVAVNGSLWTIPIELRLYLVVAGVGLLGLFKKSRILIGLFLIAIITQIIFEQAGLSSGRKILSGPVPVFLLGAIFFCLKERLSQRWIWLGLLVIFWIPLRSTPFIGHFLTLLTFCYGFHLLTKIKKIRPLDVGRFGDYSYGVYLYSAPIQQVLVWKGIKDGWSVFLISLILSLVAGMLSWHFIEKKSIRP